MPCESLDEFWKTRTHSRACGGCHASTFSSWGVIENHAKTTQHVENRVELKEAQA